MEKLLLILLFFVSWSSANAQDKIITIKHDTIECRIVSINADRITYEQKTANNQFVGMSITTSEVLQYSRTAKSDNPDSRFYREKATRERPENPWLFSLQGGLSHSLTDYDNSKKILTQGGNSAALVDDYFGKLQNGYHFNASVHHLITTSFGLGVDYNLFYAASKGDFLYNSYGSTTVPVYMKVGLDEKLYAHFVGASVLFQQKASKIKITETISPGIVLLRNESRDYQFQGYGGYGGYGNSSYYDQTNTLSTGTTFGVKGSMAIEYALTPQLSAGLAGNFVWAELNKISVKSAVTELNDQKLSSPIKLSHIDYGFIVRYNFKQSPGK